MKEDPHSWDKFIIHASYKKKEKEKKKTRLQPNFQFLLLNFKPCNFVTEKNFSKKIRFVFNENIDKFLCLEKIRSKNTDQFLN